MFFSFLPEKFVLGAHRECCGQYEKLSTVIPAKERIQGFIKGIFLNPGFRREDGFVMWESELDRNVPVQNLGRNPSCLKCPGVP